MLDLDGTIYQTLDLKERAWHATTSNSRSVGIEIANIGAYPPTAKTPLPNGMPKTPTARPASPSRPNRATAAFSPRGSSATRRAPSRSAA